MTASDQIMKLLESFHRAKKEIIPADENLLAEFCSRMVQYGAPRSVIEQLVEFYKISNGLPYFNGFRFHRCDDEILFEWWANGVLWLGQRDCDVLQWAEDKFCLGDASNISYGEKYEFSTLVDLLQVAFEEWEITAKEEN